MISLIKFAMVLRIAGAVQKSIQLRSSVRRLLPMRKVEQPDERGAHDCPEASVLQGKVQISRKFTLTHREPIVTADSGVHRCFPQAMAVKTPAITANASPGGDHHHPPPRLRTLSSTAAHSSIA